MPRRLDVRGGRAGEVQLGVGGDGEPGPAVGGSPDSVSLANMSRAALGRAYYWYLGAQFVSVAGTMMGYTALFWLGLHVRHGGGTALASIDAAMMLPMLLFSRRAGGITAAHRSNRILVVTQSLQAAGLLAIGTLLLATQMTIWVLVPICFVIGCVQCVDVTARQIFMLDLVGDDALRKGTSQYAAVAGLAKIAGPGIAGLVLAVSSETAVFFVDAISFLGVIAVLIWLPSGVKHDAKTDGGGVRRFSWVLDLPREVQAVVLMALLVGGFGQQFSVLNPLMARNVLHLGPKGFGLFGTCAAVGAVAGAFWSARRKNPGRYEFVVWSGVFGVAECAAATMPVAWAYDTFLAVIGAATQLFIVSATVYVQQAAPDSQRGPALSAYNSAYMGFVPAGAFVAVGIAAAAGTRWALILPGLAIVACAGGLAMTSRRAPRATAAAEQA